MPLKICGLPYPEKLLNSSILITGQSGSGKSILLKDIVIQLLEMLLSLEEGVKSFSVSFAQQGSMNQDIVTGAVLRKLAKHYAAEIDCSRYLPDVWFEVPPAEAANGREASALTRPRSRLGMLPGTAARTRLRSNEQWAADAG